MKKLLFVVLLSIATAPITKTEIGCISGDITTLKARAKYICETDSSKTTGPSISKYSQENRMLFAKLETLEYFKFQTQEDADEIQMGCYNGGSMTVEWYYLDVDWNNSQTNF